MAETRAKITIQLDLFLVLRREARMPTLRCDRIVAASLENERAFAESCAGCDDRDIALMDRQLAVLQHAYFGIRQMNHAVCRRAEVIDEPHVYAVHRGAQALLAHRPWHVGRTRFASDDRAGNPEACAFDGFVARAEKVRADIFEATKSGGLVAMIAQQMRRA